MSSSKIYSAQKENPINGDFCKELFEDMRMIGLNLNDNHIKGIAFRVCS